MSLIRAMYVSRPSGAGANDFDLTVAAILGVSRARNQMAGVTGALLASHDCFMQALEGTPGAVSAIMESILRDPRHQAIRRFPDLTVDRLLFGDWSMYFGRLDEVDAPLARAFSRDGTLDPFRMDQERVTAFLYACAVAPTPSTRSLRLDRLLESAPMVSRKH